MRVLREWWATLDVLRHKRTYEQTLDEEIRFHVEMHAEQLRRAGVPPEEARRRALVAFGGRDRFKEEVRDARGGRWLDDLAQDLRYALRGLRRAPAFTAIAVASLALGIGANTAVFSVVNAVLLRPLPFPAPDELVRVGVRERGAEDVNSLSAADVQALQTMDSFAEFGAYRGAQGGLTLTGAGDAERVDATLATSGVFRTLGARPLFGRLPVAEDDVPGAPQVVLTSHAFWRDRLGGTTEALGSPLTLDGERSTVIGVMPPGFRIPGTQQADLWPVLQLDPPEARAPFWLLGIARLAPGVAPARVHAELATLAAAVKRQYPESPPQWEYDAPSLKGELVRDARPTLLAMYGAVALILLMTAANVANLMLARATGRGPELALRTALGAGRQRLVRQLLTESLLVAALGGVLGLIFAVSGVRALVAVMPVELPRLDEIGVDMVVLLFTVGIALLTGIAVGLAPALQVPHRVLGAQLREGGRGMSDGGVRRRMRSTLVVVEFALALTVLIGAGLLVNTLVRLQHVNPGFAETSVLVARLTVPEARYPEGTQFDAFVDQLLGQLEALPGVSAASVSMSVPPNQLRMTNPFTPQDKLFGPEERAPLAEQLLVGTDYFDVLGIPIRRGRAFTDADREGAPGVVIINETLARRHFPDGDAVGRWLQTGAPSPDAPRLTIVGIVPDVKYAGLDAEPEATIYVPYKQHLWWRSPYIVIRTAGDPLGQIPALRGALAAVDPQVPLQDVWTMERLLYESVAQPRFRAALLGGFGLIALVLAGAGIYGVLSYTVSQRRRETAVRLALGARPRDVVRLVVGDGMRLALVGVGAGLALSLLATRLLSELLYGVSPLDPMTFGLMALFLIALALLACALPARRATRADPMTALRTE
ncbi:MAG: ABC transporter permease [Gemmatimonadota bacterium]|nr:ABC transporter permease [Gemmatimonadota bacterium]